ncbi:MAG: thioredoxin family protein [Porphyromonadaceae bacterium]|nr:thioredoxin family protein [Porphyromonadaceae bacterium]
MRKWVLSLAMSLSACLAVLGQGSKQGIQFFEGTLEEALVQAGKDNKLVFIDYYATWCVPCKKMDKLVFTDAKVGEYFNDKFINLQLDAEKPENKASAKLYKVEAFPTMVFVAPDGKLKSVLTGYHEASELLKAGKTVGGDLLGVSQLYDQYRKDSKNLDIQQQILIQAPDFLMAQEGIEADKWTVRLSRLYKSYIKAKKGPQLINKEDYIILSTLGGDDAALKEELVQFISDNLASWIAAVGNAPAYYVMEYNDAQIESLAKERKTSYTEYLEKIRTVYKDAYAIAPEAKLSPYSKAKLTADALYHLYKDKDAKVYIAAMRTYFDKMEGTATPNEYAKAAQELYVAIGDKLPKDVHREAIAWLEEALKGADITVMDRVNFVTMMGDSEKALGAYDKAQALYNQAYAESLQLTEMEMVQQMIQGRLRMRLAELELLR